MPPSCAHCNARTGDKHHDWCLCILVDMVIDVARGRTVA